ncbi:MAG: ribonuclease III [Candidatus Marinimicrobia bacterium]|nr:ribonuclease III [Candidatus Neomarinimicrobiota bacterium]
MSFAARIRAVLSGRPGNPNRKLESRLGYFFRKPELLALALTHRSVSDLPQRNFERLEFLGDAVLSHVVSDHFYAGDKSASEGDLTLQRSALVNKDVLAEIGESLGISEFINVQSGVDLDDAKVRRNMTGDVLESIIGAIYRDGGLQPVTRFIRKHIISQYDSVRETVNYKGQLLEYCHQHNLANPRFQIIKTAGPEHDKQFTVRVKIAARSFAQAEGHTKKAAEQAAADAALNDLL